MFYSPNVDNSVDQSANDHGIRSKGIEADRDAIKKLAKANK